MTTTEPISHASPVQRPRPLFSWLAFFTSGAILAFLAFELVYSVQPMKMVFNDFKLKLPAPTQLLLSLSDLFASGGWIAFVITPVVLGFVVPRLGRGAKVRTPEDYARIINRLVAMMIVGLAAMGIIVIFHVAMEMPMTTLIEGISGRR